MTESAKHKLCVAGAILAFLVMAVSIVMWEQNVLLLSERTSSKPFPEMTLFEELTETSAQTIWLAVGSVSLLCGVALAIGAVKTRGSPKD